MTVAQNLNGSVLIKGDKLYENNIFHFSKKRKDIKGRSKEALENVLVFP
jgi:hypothetical protein